MLAVLLLLAQNDFVQLFLTMWNLTNLASVIASALLKRSLSSHQLLLGVGSDVTLIFSYLLWVVKLNLIGILVSNDAAKFDFSVFLVDLALVELAILIDLVDDLRLNVDISNTWTLVLCRIFLRVHGLAVVDVYVGWIVLLLKEWRSLAIQKVASGLVSPVLLKLWLHLLHACANTGVLGVINFLE